MAHERNISGEEWELLAVPSEYPVKTSRSKRQHVLFEVYQVSGGAYLYIPDRFAWEGLHGFHVFEQEALVCSLSDERAWREMPWRQKNLARVVAESRALIQQSRALCRLARKTPI